MGSVWLCVIPLEATEHLDSHQCESASPLLPLLPGKSWDIFERLILSSQKKYDSLWSLIHQKVLKGPLGTQCIIEIRILIIKCSVSLSNYMNRNRKI